MDSREGEKGDRDVLKKLYFENLELPKEGNRMSGAESSLCSV